MTIKERWRKLWRQPEPEITDADMEAIRKLCNIYFGAVRRYGDDGHDQFVELMEKRKR